MKDDYNKLPAKILTLHYIKNQNNSISTLLEDYPELALLKLGKISELYLLQLLQLDKKPTRLNLIWEAKNNNLLTNSQAKIFESNRKESNALKHQLYYSSNQEIIVQLWKSFSKVLS